MQVINRSSSEVSEYPEFFKSLKVESLRSAGRCLTFVWLPLSFATFFLHPRVIVAMRKRSKIAVACLSFLIGLFLSSVLLHFLFGSSIYSRHDYRGLMAPSYYFLSIGQVTLFDRVLSYLVDATVFGAITYSSIGALSWLLAVAKK